jgi:PAS domain S-box-containing protein
MGHSEMSVNTQLLNFINNTNSPVFITNISGEIVWINQGLTTSFGYTSAELLGELLYSWQGQIKDVLEQIVADKKNTRQELLFVDKQDRKHCVDVEVSILPAEGDKSEQILFFGHKVSPFPYQLYSSLDYRRQLETLINNYPGGAITIVDKDLHLIYPQGQGYQQAVLGLQTFKGKHLKEFAPEVVYNALQKKMPVLEDGKSFSHKVKIKNFTFNNTYQPVFDENGQLSSIIIITNNITTLHHYQKQVAKHQDKYQALFELANDAIILVNPANQQINAANQAAVQLLGYSKEEFLALERHQLFLPAIQEQTLQAWNQQLEEKEEARLDTIWVNKAGEQIQIEMLSKVITLPNEEVLMVIGKDRTDYIKIRQALEKSHTIYQSLFEHSLSGVLFANDEGRYMAVNPAACRLLGYSKEELLQLHVWDIMPNSNKEEGKLAWKHFITEDSLTGEYEVVSKDGTHRITEFQAVFNVQKGLHMSIFYDVTERKKIEKALADTTKDLRDAVQAGKVGLWGWNIQTNEVEFSHEWKAQIGYDDNDQFTTLKDFTSSIHPNERALLQAYMDKILSGDVDTIALEFRLRHKDGSYRWVSTQGAVFTDETGKRTSIKGTQIDITENKEILRALKGSENRLELALKSTGLGTWDWNLQTGEVIFNDRWAEILGYMPQEVAQNISTWEKTRVHPDDRQRVKEEIATFFQLGITIQENDFRVITPDEKVKYLKSSAYIEYDKQGKPLYGTGLTIDLTHIKEAEEKAKQASKAKSEFLANMSHEIKTPLNGVIGFVDLLLETSLNDSQQEYLKIVHQSAYTLLDIISDILDFSKIEAGKMHISVTQTEIIPLINQVVSMVKYVAQKKKLELLLNLPENLPQFLFIDGVRFKQILTNLLSNAVKFTEKGEIELTIEVLEQLPNQETKFRFAIKDTGIGIAPENQAKVLEAFSQADASTTRKFGGTGLGLTITNKLLNLMGSQLHMKSVLNEGSTFYFDIPLKYELGNNLQVEKLVGVNKVMVVDNNEKHCELLQKILQDWGIEVSVATNGIELLQQLTDGKRYDVVLIDYQMPFMDGLQCIEKIRQDLRIPRQQQEIILLNNIANTEEVLQQCEAYGVGQSLAKPLHAQKIYQALSKLVEIQEKRRNTSKEARKILIVEDNEINAILTQSIVERIMPNAVIKEALNGAEAVKVYEEEAPDLILMDIQMPVMNGHEACREIRKIENNETHPTKIIALTANTSVGEKERCLASGMDDYMSKPIAQAMIEDLLMKWLNLS